jgi:hypothetical protein
MENQDHTLTSVSRKRLETQGYLGFTDSELSDFTFGIRFAYYACGSLVILGLVLTSMEILASVMIIAFFGIFPPYHPFDYLYNYAIRHAVNKPKTPPRSNQGRFACGVATVWLAGIIYCFYIGLNGLGYIAGGILVAIAALVSTTDICVPSMIYNFWFTQKKITNR